ncbi:MAG: hypothetical protein IKF78_11780 [Atopobiaceae bacterium]|nr:hypothetical protein [Atopobiaceae bacterium]
MRRACRALVCLAIVLVACYGLAGTTGCAAVGGGASAASETTLATLADGTYTVEVSLEGGSGRASVASPATMEVRAGEATLTVVWSSPNYDYMVVDGERYLPVNQTGNSTFQIPVPSLGEPFKVVANTTAMSTPHEIEYELTVSNAAMHK